MSSRQYKTSSWKIHWSLGYEAGRKWMLESIRASLRNYPNEGGDVEVMREVERIVKEAIDKYAREFSLCMYCQRALDNQQKGS